MPDLTLYSEDIQFLREALATTRKIAQLGSGSELTRECDRMSDLLLDRIIQGLHKSRNQDNTNI